MRGGALRIEGGKCPLAPLNETLDIKEYIVSALHKYLLAYIGKFSCQKYFMWKYLALIFFVERAMLGKNFRHKIF